MNKVVVIGSGNVAHHLIAAFLKSTENQLIQVIARHKTAFASWVPERIQSDFSTVDKEADCYIIAVTDAAIAQVAQQLNLTGKLILHTSGSVEKEVLPSSNRRGVLYPLQTFSKNKPVDFTTVPLCLEAETTDDLALLHHIANTLSSSVHDITAAQRKVLHVAAVFVCNFVNHLYVIGEELCQQHQLPFELLQPLLLETAEKVTVMRPLEAQTGPAKRKDTEVVQKHLQMLQSEQHRKLYTILTQSILNHEPKL